jgi:hypothetical protein
MLQPSLVTPAQLRRFLTAAEDRVERLKVELATALKEAELFRQLLLLQSDDERSRMRSNMQLDTAGKKKSTKIAAANVKNEGGAREILLAADRSDQDIAGELAKHFGAVVGRSTVNAWHTGRRPIPRVYRDYLEKKYPGTGPAWPRVAD